MTYITGKTIRELRERNHLTQKQLADKLCVSDKTISKWETGVTTPELDKLIQLSRLFEISIDELVGNTRHEERPETAIREKTVEVHFCRGHYEYKSKRMLFGLPLVHINVGHGVYKAKGILAIGTVAKGMLSIGGVSMGMLSFGGACCGLFSIGGISLALLLAIGGISIGTMAIGGLALGVLAIGGCAIGIYSIGGAAIAAKIAAGGYASAPIAIGDSTNGQIVFDIHEQIPADAIRDAILGKFPKTWKAIVELFSSIH